MFLDTVQKIFSFTIIFIKNKMAEELLLKIKTKCFRKYQS